MFHKILIANRGEIACRVMATARRMGLRTVAVYSDADQSSRHVSMADEAVWIGAPQPAKSYLAIENIVRACRESGSEAVHPGYGFLSENAEFAVRLTEEEIVFIGPHPRAIQSMGDKITSKQLASAAGVNVIPGSSEVIQDADHAVSLACEIGYPVMLKASAGGGGKGLRVARNDSECRAGFQRAASEALTSFDDERMFVEKYIEDPRHIEIQVLADHFENVVHLGERECSLQRRHQKVIEEAPSPFLDEATRAAMADQAVALARAVEYRSAGTVEFIVDADRNFFFLEMNTRLQVEHPVTERITGLDLVELMIRIAAGEALPFSQADVTPRGCAIEARVYAEDPRRGFLPSTGRLVRYLPPAESASVRVDSGVHEGSEISIYYDPLIAKLITHGATRAQAIVRMCDALNEFYVQGVAHNIGFLTALIRHEQFMDGRATTNLIDDEFADGYCPAERAVDHPGPLVAVAAAIHKRYMDRAAQIAGQLPGYGRSVDPGWVVVCGRERFEVEVRSIAGGHEVDYAGNTDRLLSDWRFGQPIFQGSINDAKICVQIERHNLIYRLFHRGAQVDMMVLTPQAAQRLDWLPPKEAPDMSRYLLSPMPGLLAQVVVSVGDQVASGQELAIVEAMKMENVLRAERDGRVSKVLAGQGETVSVDQPILEFE